MQYLCNDRPLRFRKSGRYFSPTPVDRQCSFDDRRSPSLATVNYRLPIGAAVVRCSTGDRHCDPHGDRQTAWSCLLDERQELKELVAVEDWRRLDHRKDRSSILQGTDRQMAWHRSADTGRHLTGDDRQVYGRAIFSSRLMKPEIPSGYYTRPRAAELFNRSQRSLERDLDLAQLAKDTGSAETALGRGHRSELEVVL